LPHHAQSLDYPLVELDELSLGEMVDVDFHGAASSEEN
jgi:hypothetical protein